MQETGQPPSEIIKELAPGLEVLFLFLSLDY